MTGAASFLPLVFALLAAGGVAGFAGGLFGIGGGFIVVPALVLILPLMGATTEQVIHVAVGTSLATIIFTSLRSVRSHARRGAVDGALLKSWAPWVVGGTIAGAVVADLVSGATLATIFGAGVLLFAGHFLTPAITPTTAPRDAPGQAVRGHPDGAAKIALASGTGLLSALLGIGGGTIATMVMTVYGMPIHRAIGTASGLGAIIAIPGASGFMLIGRAETGLPWGSVGYVNLPAALAIITTAVLCAPLGVAAAHRLSPVLLRTVFGLYLILAGVTMIANQ